MYEHLRLKDDLGRRVPPYDPLARGVSREARADFPEEEFEQVRRSLIRAAGCRPAASAAMCLVLIGFGLLSILVAVLTRQWGAGLARTLLLAAAGGFGWYSFRWGFGNPEVKLLRQEMLAIGRCPSCAYPLRDSPSDAEGFTTCPECAAAWVLPFTGHPPPSQSLPVGDSTEV